MNTVVSETIERIHAHWEKRREKPLRFFSTTFFTHERTVRASIPIPKEAHWNSLAYVADLFKPKEGVMLVAPLVWQIEPLFHDILHQRGIPVSVLHGGNLPVAVEVMRQAHMRAAAVAHASLDAFVEETTHASILETLDIVLSFSPLSSYEEQLPLRKHRGPVILKEIHLSPGCPLLYQTIEESGTNLYRLNSDFNWEISSVETTITANTARVLPITHFKLPFSVVQQTKYGYTISV